MDASETLVEELDRLLAEFADILQRVELARMLALSDDRTEDHHDARN